MRALLVTAVAVTWGLLLTKADVYRDRVLGHGATEYKRVVWATVLEFAGFSILGYMVGVRLSTAYLVAALAISIAAVIAFLFMTWSHISSVRVPSHLPETAAHLVVRGAAPGR